MDPSQPSHVVCALYPSDRFLADVPTISPVPLPLTRIAPWTKIKRSSSIRLNIESTVRSAVGKASLGRKRVHACRSGQPARSFWRISPRGNGHAFRQACVSPCHGDHPMPLLADCRPAPPREGAVIPRTADQIRATTTCCESSSLMISESRACMSPISTPCPSARFSTATR